jgi:four helix bundle protein
MLVRCYRDLIAWQRSIELVSEIYLSTKSFPVNERFGLTAQIRRAAVSIPSNIAEGQGRCTTGEFRQFLGHARGSLLEVETQIFISANLGYLIPKGSPIQTHGRGRAHSERIDQFT